MEQNKNTASSFEQRFYIENPSLPARFKRNSHLLVMLFLAAWAWMFKGYRLRRAVQQAKRSKKPLNLEDWLD